MLVNKHIFVDGRCIHCGATQTLGVDQRSCLSRPGNTYDLRPEPARRTAAIDDVATIKLRLDELAASRNEVASTATTHDVIEDYC